MNGSPRFSARLLAGVGGVALLAVLSACAAGSRDVAFSDTYSIDTERASGAEAPMDYDTFGDSESTKLASVETVATVDGNTLVTSRGRLHSVVTGDTLWDISDSYLADNFLWPKVWDYNGEIMNPDLIYPGDRIRIPIALLPPDIQELIPDVEAIEVEPVPEEGFGAEEELPTIGEVTAGEGEIATEEEPKSVVELYGVEENEIPEEFRAEVAEEMAVERPEEPVKVVEWSVPRGAINPSLVESAGYITRRFRSTGRLVGMYEPRNIMGDRDDVFLKLNWFHSAAPGDMYFVVRMERPVYHPLTDDAIGKLVRVLGVLTVQEEANNGLYRARIDRSFETILSGDLLVPYERPDVNMDLDSPQNLAGMIIETRDSMSLVGRGHIVYIDLGRRDGLKPGNRFEILQRGRKVSVPGLFVNPRLPTRTIGMLQVLSVQDRTAAAEVLRAEIPVEVGDRLQSILPSEDAESGTGADGGAG